MMVSKRCLMLSRPILLMLVMTSADACVTGDLDSDFSLNLLFSSPVQPHSVCYGEFGCFSRRYPFDDMPSPEDPRLISPRYLQLSLNKAKNQVIHRQLENATQFDASNIVVITHGFTGSFEGTKSWVEPAVVAIIRRNPSVNVFFIEWKRGAAVSLKSLAGVYGQAASNTRVVAAASIMFLLNNPQFNISNSHCIGFSLGAHVCGFMSKYIGKRWNRLSAIDPAAPLFDKEDYPQARVDKSDAKFVDAIHTSPMGLNFDIGHVDFYVNDIKLQPGCEKEFVPPGTPAWLVGEISAYFACSHFRAPRLFAETILPHSKCDRMFRFCPCVNTEPNFSRNWEDSCRKNETQMLGYGAFIYNSKRHGAFCGRTTAEPPFC